MTDYKIVKNKTTNPHMDAYAAEPKCDISEERGFRAHPRSVCGGYGQAEVCTGHKGRCVCV